MGKMKFELDSDGVVALMKSAEMLNVCEEYAKNALSRLGDGYEMEPYLNGKTRVNVAVKATTRKTRNENMKNNTILKAVQG